MRPVRGGENRPPGEPKDHALGRSRGGFGTKLVFISDGRGLPLSVDAAAGQRHESPLLEPTLEETRLTRPAGEAEERKWPGALAGDRGVSAARNREGLAERRIESVIPYKRDELARMDTEPPFDREAYKRRNAVERLIGWLKECRRIATRYEKLAIHYLAMLSVAMIRLYLRRHFADTT